MKDDRRSITWIAWKNVLAHQNNGGLGINSLKAQNLSLLSKWWWRLKCPGTELWKEVIFGIHGSAGGIPSALSGAHRKITGVWGSIAGIHQTFGSININLPSLFNLSSVTCNGATTEKWTWLLENSGSFTSSSLRFCADENLLHNSLDLKTFWYKSVPSKVNILAWRIQHHRLPTRVNLDHRDIDTRTVLCPLCDAEAESEDHLFIKCEAARLVLNAVFAWWSIDIPDGLIIDDFFKDEFNGISGRKLHSFRAVIFVHFWTVWNARNAWLFSKKKEIWTKLLEKVQTQSFFWHNTRCKKRDKKMWSNWCCNPL